MKKRSLAAVIAAVLLSCWLPAAAATTPIHAFGFGQSTPFANPVDPAAVLYCQRTGGQVEIRSPVYGTNNPPSQQLVLDGDAAFCNYVAKDHSHIFLLISTLYSKMPTLAALAYYAKVPISKSCGAGGANPASCYCTQLGGSDQFGGTNLAGGAWVLRTSKNYADLEACIFPDMSSIDSWGLTYHSHNIVRGIDLSAVLRYKGR